MIFVGPPATPLNFSIARGNATYVMVHWISSNNGGYPQIFLLEYQVATANAWTIMTVHDLGEFQNITAEISELTRNSDYHFRVKSRSDRIRGPNESGYTHVLSYITPPGSTPLVCNMYQFHLSVFERTIV